MLERVKIQISKTADGENHYVQLTSSDLLSLNIVIVARDVEIQDDRRPSTRRRSQTVNAADDDTDVNR